MGIIIYTVYAYDIDIKLANLAVDKSVDFIALAVGIQTKYLCCFTERISSIPQGQTIQELDLRPLGQTGVPHNCHISTCPMNMVSFPTNDNIHTAYTHAHGIQLNSSFYHHSLHSTTLASIGWYQCVKT